MIEAGEAAAPGVGEEGWRGVVRRHGLVAGQVYVHVANAALYLLTRVLLIEGDEPLRLRRLPPDRGHGRHSPPCLPAREKSKIKAYIEEHGSSVLACTIWDTISQNLTFAGLSLTNTTLSSTMHNLNPAITFIMAVCLRLEKVDVWNRRGQAKIIGTLLCVGGAMVVTLVKGPVVNILKVQKQPFTALHPNLSPSSLRHIRQLDPRFPTLGHWILVMVGIVEGAPSEVTGAAWICGIGAVQSLVVPSWSNQLLHGSSNGTCSF